MCLDPTYRSIKVGDGKTSPLNWVVKGDNLSFGGRSASFDLFVVEDVPVDVTIGSPNLEWLERTFNTGHSYFSVIIDGTELQLGFQYGLPRMNLAMSDQRDREDFSSSVEEDQGDTSTDVDEEAYFIYLDENGTGEEPEMTVQDERDKEAILLDKLGRFQEIVKDELMRKIIGSNLAAWSLHELIQEDVPVENLF